MDMDTKKIIHLGDYNVEESFKQALRESKIHDVLISYDFNSKYYTAIKVYDVGSDEPEQYNRYCTENNLNGKAKIYENTGNTDIWTFKMYIKE